MADQALAGAKKNAGVHGQTIVFIDESGLSERPTLVRSWGAGGTAAGHPVHLSLDSALGDCRHLLLAVLLSLLSGRHSYAAVAGVSQSAACTDSRPLVDHLGSAQRASQPPRARVGRGTGWGCAT